MAKRIIYIFILAAMILIISAGAVLLQSVELLPEENLSEIDTTVLAQVLLKIK